MSEIDIKDYCEKLENNVCAFCKCGADEGDLYPLLTATENKRGKNKYKKKRLKFILEINCDITKNHFKVVFCSVCEETINNWDSAVRLAVNSN